MLAVRSLTLSWMTAFPNLSWSHLRGFAEKIYFFQNPSRESCIKPFGSGSHQGFCRLVL